MSSHDQDSRAWRFQRAAWGLTYLEVLRLQRRFGRGGRGFCFGSNFERIKSLNAEKTSYTDLSKTVYCPLVSPSNRRWSFVKELHRKI